MAKQNWGLWFKILTITVACAALAIALVTVVVVLITVKDLTAAANAMARLKIVLGYEILIITFFYGLMVLLYMAAGEIDLSLLLSEPKGTDAQGNPLSGASMSRFQLLIFTFVIALSLVLIIIANGATKFPAIPSEILVLLGISASTYAVGKGIQSSGGGSNGGGNGGGASGGTSASGGGGAGTAKAAPTPGAGA